MAGHPEWIDDPRFATSRDRTVNARELIGLLDSVFATKTLDEWAAIFATEPDMFWAPVASPEEVLADPQTRAAGGIVDVPNGTGVVPMIASPADFHGTPGEPRSVAPRIGQHSREILRELGRSDADIDALAADGVIAVDA